ncbi:MAG: PA2779 family protein [Proteobacteria bacterium]|nr:PA2779 family protein [Pseudomonadota bacterium]
MTIRFRRVMAGLLIVCMGGLTAPLPALAGIVGTDTVVAGVERERLASLLERSDVRARLESLGVDATDAKARVAALSDTEAAQLAAQMDELPAGGDLLGAAVLVFLVLLATDIMGYTKIFPFTRSTR